ncbi:MAG: carboxypeptidase-like regulatory domain-containing protein [Enterocloster sp.]
MKERKGKLYLSQRSWLPETPACFILAGIFLMVVIFLSGCGLGTDVKVFPIDNMEDTRAKTETVSKTAITLLMDKTDFITGSESTATISVLYSGEISDAIIITDGNNTEICEIENDGSGYGEARITVPAKQDGCVIYQAVSESCVSNRVICYIHPEITMEMVRTLADVSEDMGDFVKEQKFDDPHGTDALDKVKDYLLSDDRVADAWENDGAILYATTDSLMGSYGLGASGDTSFGGDFSDPYETYCSFVEGKDVSNETIKSVEALTNSKILYLSPLPEDKLVSAVKESFAGKASDLSDAINGKYVYAERESAWELLNTGEFTDSGFLMMVTHGKRLERKNGTYMFCFAMGHVDLSEFEEVFDGTRMNAGMLWGSYDKDGEYLYSRESYRLLYDYDLSEPESSHTLFATTNYMESVLSDRVFDNTIIYFCVCHSAVDEELITLLFDHGAAVYIGSIPELKASVSYSTLSALVDVLGSGGKIREVPNVISKGDYDAGTTEWYNEVVAPISDGETLLGGEIKMSRLESDIVWRIRDAANRTVKGKGSLSGDVVDKDGLPVKGADVTIHHWLDHGYVVAGETKTDIDGHYEFSEVDTGLYGITAVKELGESHICCTGDTVLEFSPDHTDAESIVIAFKPPAVFSSAMGEYKGTIYKIGDALEADGIHIEAFPVKSPKEQMYICRFAFYDDQIFYCCKEAGTSGFHSELWVCDLDGGNAHKLRDDCTEFEIWGSELHCWDDKYYDLKEECWKTADPEKEYMWGSPQFYTINGCFMEWPGDGVYRNNYRVQKDGTITHERNSRIFDYNSGETGELVNDDWLHLVLATEQYLFFDVTEKNTCRFCCYDMKTKSIHILDVRTAAGSGKYFGW